MFGCAVGAIIFLPLMPFIALAIKLDSRGPVFVRLPRVSRGRQFYIYKFRSMVPGAHMLKKELMHLNERKDGPFFKIKNDPRITCVGRFLRKYRVDEFPQLFNVLKGELSLVGPRAHEPEEVAAYPADFHHLPRAIAGITGYSQINGSASLPFIKELELDDWYLKNRSFWFDLKIIANTLWILFRDDHAY